MKAPQRASAREDDPADLAANQIRFSNPRKQSIVFFKKTIDLFFLRKDVVFYFYFYFLEN
jgi:hypothetical protein